MRAPSEGSRRTERHETQPFHGRRILITGGATGTGFEAAQALHRLGAEVVIGTRSEGNFARAAEKLGTERVSPFIADLTNSAQVKNVVARMHDQGVGPTDVIFSAAGGMEPFMPQLMRGLVTVKRTEIGEERDSALARLQPQIDQWVEETREGSKTINFDGQVNLLDQLRGRGTEVKAIDYSSIWSSTLAGVPRFYRGIAKSKHLFEEWMEEHAAELVADGVYPAIVSGHVISDSNVGKVTERFILPLFPPDEQEAMLKTFIRMNDMVRATEDVLKSDPKQWTSVPKRLFVVNGGEMRTHLSPDDPIFSHRIPV